MTTPTPAGDHQQPADWLARLDRDLDRMRQSVSNDERARLIISRARTLARCIEKHRMPLLTATWSINRTLLIYGTQFGRQLTTEVGAKGVRFFRDSPGKATACVQTQGHPIEEARWRADWLMGTENEPASDTLKRYFPG